MHLGVTHCFYFCYQCRWARKKLPSSHAKKAATRAATPAATPAAAPAAAPTAAPAPASTVAAAEPPDSEEDEPWDAEQGEEASEYGDGGSASDASCGGRAPGAGANASGGGGGRAGAYDEHVSRSLEVLDPELINTELIEALVACVIERLRLRGPAALVEVSRGAG